MNKYIQEYLNICIVILISTFLSFLTQVKYFDTITVLWPLTHMSAVHIVINFYKTKWKDNRINWMWFWRIIKVLNVYLKYALICITLCLLCIFVRYVNWKWFNHTIIIIFSQHLLTLYFALYWLYDYINKYNISCNQPLIQHL